MLVFSAAAVTMALQVLAGVLGIGLTVLLFVVIGNPSAGGAYQPSLLPAFWRSLSYALPNGAGTDTIRRIVYFGGDGITGHLVVIAVMRSGARWHRSSSRPCDQADEAITRERTTLSSAASPARPPRVDSHGAVLTAANADVRGRRAARVAATARCPARLGCGARRSRRPAGSDRP